jgi:hypothetical protein
MEYSKKGSSTIENILNNKKAIGQDGLEDIECFLLFYNDQKINCHTYKIGRRER